MQALALLDAWATWRPRSSPFVLDADRQVLLAGACKDAIAIRDSWAAAYSAHDFCAWGDTRLHLGLLPHPFCGDLRRASVYILMLNPGLGPTDYFGEYEVPAYREAALAILRQEFQPGAIPYLFLDPQYAWHGGFTWWYGKLAGVIGVLAREWKVSFAEARARLGKRIASIELMPYHSQSFRDAGGWLRSLPSVALAKGFVRDYVVPRVVCGQAVVIVTRQTAAWDLPDHPGVIRYSAGAARAAHLTPASPGGKAILNQVLKTEEPL